MRLWVFFFFIIFFLLLGQNGNAQVAQDSLVQKGDTTFFYFKNGCLKEKGIWRKNKWIGEYYQYFENPCGQVKMEFIYDNQGRFISVKSFNEQGMLWYEHNATENSGLTHQMMSDSTASVPRSSIDTTLRKGDTAYSYFKNGCVAYRSVWKKLGCTWGYALDDIYYEAPCGQIWKETKYDSIGDFFLLKEFDKKGNLIRNQISNFKYDSCRYYVGDYFCPDCRMDTARGTWQVGSYSSDCHCWIDSMHVTVHDVTNSKIIYQSTKEWYGKIPLTERPEIPHETCYYPSGKYPYEIIIYRKGKTIKMSGVVSLIIYYPEHICK